MFELHETTKEAALTFSYEVPRIIEGLQMGVK